jgi:hypothetical protein
MLKTKLWKNTEDSFLNAPGRTSIDIRLAHCDGDDPIVIRESRGCLSCFMVGNQNTTPFGIALRALAFREAKMPGHSRTSATDRSASS